MKDGESGSKSEVTVNGRVVPLKSPKLRESFAQLTEIERQIAALKDSAVKGDQEAQAKRISLQLSLVNLLDEVVLLITKEKKEEQMRSEASG